MIDSRLVLDIRNLFHSETEKTEDHEFELSLKEEDLPITSPVKVKAQLLKDKEGILLLIQELDFTQEGACGLCQKVLFEDTHAEGGEWMYYQKMPQNVLDPSEILLLNLKSMTLDPYEAVRQKATLHLNQNPRCELECQQFESGDEGIKALSGLKELF